MPRLTDVALTGFALTDGGLAGRSEVEAVLDRRLDRQSSAPVALALSGGGDSMALLHLAQGWAARHGRRLLALTVDHGLHPDSAAWTRFAGAAAEAVGADWRALPWVGEKPTSGLPAAARMARHRLLAEAARTDGAAVLLFAHTADDAAENGFMRQGDAPTLGSLREWSPSPVWPEGRGVFVLRPMLGLKRQALRGVLRHKGLDWLDDPANDDLRYARPRARRALAQTSPAAFQPPLYDRKLSALAETVTSTPDGRLILPRSAFEAATRTVRPRALAMAAVCASGHPSPPRGGALARLADRIDAGSGFVATLAGARVTVGRAAIVFSREPGDQARGGLQPQSVCAGRATVWDGRYDITVDCDLIIGALAGSAARLSKSDRACLAETPAEVRPALPALFHGETVSLPRPLGQGPAGARPLAAARFSAAAGLVEHERDISPFAMAQWRQSSYVEALALA